MTNCPFKSADYRDIQSVNQLAAARKKPFGSIVAYFTERYLQRYARDTPVLPCSGAIRQTQALQAARMDENQ